MKKNLLYLLIFLVLLAVAGWLLTERESDSSLSLEGRARYAFTVKDTSEIDKIIIKDKRPAEVVLSKTQGEWRVNGENKAREDAIATLLETLYRMEMRNFIPEKMQQTVIRRMSVYGKEVQLYKNGELFKVFYVGTESQDEMATYMMLKGSDQPFAVHIPGFNGFLSSRFFTEDYLWRSRDVIKIDPINIKSVEMYYPDSASSSFKLNMFSRDSAYVVSLTDNKVATSLNKVNTNLFLSAFKNLKYEGFILPTDKISLKRDSLLSSTPVFKLKLTDTDGKATTLSGYRIKSSSDYYDPDVDVPEYDLDRMHGFINDEQMVLLQYYGLRHVLKPRSFFEKR